ncbi:MAG: hypothetical protein KAG84_04585, partial [Bacteroidales bacterium]|nr:hypothetical protein [Bacteroidales bacterium]
MIKVKIIKIWIDIKPYSLIKRRVQTFAYGKMGELIENIHTFVVPGGNPYTFKMEWQYDSWNRIKDISYPDGEVVYYNYNTAGALISMNGDKGNEHFDYVSGISYDKFGSRVRLDNGNGISTRYTYDATTRRLANLKSFDVNSNLMQDIDYIYNDIGNITTVSNSAISVGGSGMGGEYYYSYVYDNLSRLINSSGNFTDSQNSNYTYNLNMQYSASGNITQKQTDATTLIGGVIQSVNYTNDYTYNTSQPHAVVGINNTHIMRWDANGNMTNLSNSETRLSRGMCWDEENRLAIVRDNDSHLSHYIYNAGGERVWKLTGAIERMSINGDDFIDQAILDKTLYTNPYMVLTEREYTKHYYIESQRVTSKIGGGMQNNLVDPMNGTLTPIEGTIMGLAEELQGNLLSYSCSDGIEIEIDAQFRNMDMLMQQDNNEDEQFFYHSDHLGSSSWITDADGYVNQHLQYMP